jgi:Domain of unknown function (DUF932)
MPTGITSSDSMFSVRQTPWHGLGAVLDQPPTTIAEAIERSGLGWRVEREPIAIDRGDAATVDDWWLPRREEIPGWWANVRQDTRQVLGIVGDRYRIVQNIEAFQFVDQLIGSAMHFETAGSLHGGRRVWVLAQLPEHIEVGGDPVRPYVLLMNSQRMASHCLLGEDGLIIRSSAGRDRRRAWVSGCWGVEGVRVAGLLDPLLRFRSGIGAVGPEDSSSVPRAAANVPRARVRRCQLYPNTLQRCGLVLPGPAGACEGGTPDGVRSGRLTGRTQRARAKGPRSCVLCDDLAMPSASSAASKIVSACTRRRTGCSPPRGGSDGFACARGAGSPGSRSLS